MASGRVEELPDDFDEKVNLNATPPGAQPPPAQNGIPEASLEAMLAGASPFPPKKDAQPTRDSSQPGPRMPPAMETVRQYTADELIKEMNKSPLFMTSLEDDGEENIALEALKAMAYEGTRAEIAANFREQGNEAARARLWTDAREYYSKAIGTLRMSDEQLQEVKGGEGPAEMEPAVIDQDEEEKKEKEVHEASLVNRALCNLEMKNYGSCNRDCAAALTMNPKNVKAWYRSATACLALDKLPEAENACGQGLSVDPSNAALKTLSAKIIKRKTTLEELERKRKERDEQRRKEESTLKLALKSRNIPTRKTDTAPDMEDAALCLEDPLDPASTLCIPVMFLYPLEAQSDFIKRFLESESVGQHLTYITPLPWDEKNEYTPESVECYVETTAGGLIKAGKKMSLLRILNSGKVELVDGLLSINVLPKSKAAMWIERFKAVKGKT